MKKKWFNYWCKGDWFEDLKENEKIDIGRFDSCFKNVIVLNWFKFCAGIYVCY